MKACPCNESRFPNTRTFREGVPSCPVALRSLLQWPPFLPFQCPPKGWTWRNCGGWNSHRFCYLRNHACSWLVRNAFTKQPSPWHPRRKTAFLQHIPPLRNLHCEQTSTHPGDGTPWGSWSSVPKMLLENNPQTPALQCQYLCMWLQKFSLEVQERMATVIGTSSVRARWVSIRATRPGAKLSRKACTTASTDFEKPPKLGRISVFT